MNTTQYLDAAKKKLGVQSDYALAKRLGVTTSRMGNWRSGRNHPDITIAALLAEILEVDPIRVIADMELQRGTNDAVWARIARRVAVLTCAAIGVGIGTPPPAHAAGAQPNESRVCIMLSRRRTWWDVVRDVIPSLVYL